MSDLISRADAIEAVDERWGDIKRTNKRVAKGHEAVYLDMRATISALPSADAVSREDYHNLLTASNDIDRALKEYQAKEEQLSADAEWILCSERLPKEDEYVGNVCKYYLIQDEYGDMHVAHLSGRGWETIESVKALGCDVVAWMPLPKPYREDGEA
jgi:hypothetical protein